MTGRKRGQNACLEASSILRFLVDPAAPSLAGRLEGVWHASLALHEQFGEPSAEHLVGGMEIFSGNKRSALLVSSAIARPSLSWVRVL